MNHVYHECDSERCYVCNGDLSWCVICGGSEGTLTTECCGRKITEKEEALIYKEGTLDFVGGKWINKK